MRKMVTFRAAAAFFRLGVKRTVTDWTRMIAEALFLCALIYMYHVMYGMTDAGILRETGYTVEHLTWYIAMAESCIFATGAFYKDTQQDVWDSRLGQYLLRPFGLAAMRFCEWMGQTSIRQIVFGLYGIGLAWFLTGSSGVLREVWPTLILVMLLASAVSLAVQFCIGAVALWLGNGDGVYWIWQKCSFLFGGLFLPLAMYPEWLQTLAWLTPFPVLINIPGMMAIGHPSLGIGRAVMVAALWTVIAFTVTLLTERAVTRKILREGD